MKKINLIMVTMLAIFTFSMNVKADGPTITCPLTAEVGEIISCKIKTTETVNVTSDLTLYSGSKNISADANIEFKAEKSGKYDVKISNDNSIDTATIEIKEKTTTTRTTTKTTTTTTTKKKSDNNYLESIKIDGKEIEGFDKDTTKYYYEVDYDIEKVSLEVESEDETAEVDVKGPKKLEVGDNEYVITVTAENSSTKIYKIIVTRLEEEESSNTSIKNIKIRGYKLNFDKNSKTFHLTIDKDIKSLDIDVILKDKNADYEIEDNENLEDGSVVKIIVTAEDGSKDTYRIIIDKKESNMMPIIIGSVALLIIIVVIVIIIIKNKKNKNKNKKDSDKDKNIKEEKTKEMPIIKTEVKEEKESVSEPEEETDEDNIVIDNDEEEKTRMLSFAEEEELGRTMIIKKADIFDDDLDKTKVFDYDDE